MRKTDFSNNILFLLCLSLKTYIPTEKIDPDHTLTFKSNMMKNLIILYLKWAIIVLFLISVVTSC